MFVSLRKPHRETTSITFTDDGVTDVVSQCCLWNFASLYRRNDNIAIKDYTMAIKVAFHIDSLLVNASIH